MTDTEAKALALVNEVRAEARMALNVLLCQVEHDPIFIALCRAIEREAATEARHAAELREQAERFSEALVAIRRKTVPQRCHDAFDELAAPFILPAPDPLVEALDEAWDEVGRPAQANRLHAALAARGYEVRKIGEDSHE